MKIVNRREFVAAVAGAVVAPSAVQRGPARLPWHAGTATVDITPDRSLWMAGFALRKQASQGIALPLHAKALALKTSSGPAAVLVTVDLLGVTRRITDRVATEVQRRHGIARANLLFNASHTHCGPVVDEQLSVAYDLSSDQWDAIRAYTVATRGQTDRAGWRRGVADASRACRLRARRGGVRRQPAGQIQS